MVQYNGQTETFATSDSRNFPGFDSVGVLAWYANVVHTVGEVTDGTRMCLVYDLAYEGPKAMAI